MGALELLDAVTPAAHGATGSQGAAMRHCNKPQAPRAVSHVAREAAKPRKRTMFLRAVGVGGKRSTTESERNAPNARVRSMRTSPKTQVSRVACVGAAGLSRRDAPRPSPESAVRPANTTRDWRRSGRKAELAVRRELRAHVRGTRRALSHCEPQRAMFPPDPLPSDNTGGSRAVRRAHHAAGVSA
jgi:hypothetical protein